MCQIYGKVFTQLKNLNRHVRTIHEKTASFSCMECDYSSSRQDNLNKHVKKRHSYAPSVHNIPPKIARHEPFPNIIEPPANDNLLQDIENQEFKDMLNTQAGLGLSQIPPTPATTSPPPVSNNNDNNNLSVFFTLNNLGEMIMN